jgi:hypothetical protein
MSSLCGFSLSKVGRRKTFMCFPRSLSSSLKPLVFDPYLLLVSHLQKRSTAVQSFLLAVFS